MKLMVATLIYLIVLSGLLCKGFSAGVGLSRKSALPLRSSRHVGDPRLPVQTTPISIALSAPHCLSSEECLLKLESSIDCGLSTEKVAQKQNIFGYNMLPTSKQRNFAQLVLEQFNDKLVQVMLSIAVLSGVIAAFEKNMHAYTEPMVITTILLINAIVGALQSRSAENSLEALKKLQPTYANVLRDGRMLYSLSASELVPGDVIKLTVGDRVPADARIVKLLSNTFSTDEGSLTGESATVSKTIDMVDLSASIAEKTNMVFSGTVVTSGGCLAVVTGTGTGTEIGRINTGVQEAKASESKTPLQEQVDHFVSQLSAFIGLICIGMWCASIPKFNSPAFSSSWRGAAYYAKVAVALGVAAIPEGLPAVITLCLSLGTRRMAHKNVIVRKLSSVETLGCTSVICTDKTGTLTTNRMTVKALVTTTSTADETVRTYYGVGSQNPDPVLMERTVEGTSYDPRDKINNFDETAMASSTMKLLSSVCVLCNDAHIEYKDGGFTHAGEPTEAALKVLAEKLGDLHVTRIDAAEQSAHQFSDYWNAQYERLATLEFTRNRKSMSVLVRTTEKHWENNHNNKNYLFVKGASEMVVSRCNRIQLEDGKIIEITPKIRQEIETKLQNLAKQSLRCLALAYKTGSTELGELNKISTIELANNNNLIKNSNNYEIIENNMILLGICGIKDPARKEASQAILQCNSAGIRVIMITGDSKDTAIAIAKEVNIFNNNTDISTNAFTGKEFFSYNKTIQLNLLKEGNKIFCRTEPKDKQNLIKLLEELNEIVAMTGDGVNDAPALQQAAIGISMGITGTEVAKSASDMILVDDNFATIVTAFEEGRNIYTNMQTFICFLISSNIGEVITVFLSTILNLPEILTPLHLLFINLLTDGPAATALGFNPAEKNIMKKSPRPRNQPLLSTWLMLRYLITGSYVGFATISAFIWWYLDKGVKFSELRNWSNCRNWIGFLHSAEAPRLPLKPCDIFDGPLSARPQTMAMSVLVVIEMLKALSAVSLDSSMISVPPWKNKWLMLGVALPTALHMAVMYYPPLAGIFGVAPLSGEEWKVVLLLSLPILLVEEALKLIGRRLEARRQRTSPAPGVPRLPTDSVDVF